MSILDSYLKERSAEAVKTSPTAQPTSPTGQQIFGKIDVPPAPLNLPDFRTKSERYTAKLGGFTVDTLDKVTRALNWTRAATVNLGLRTANNTPIIGIKAQLSREFPELSKEEIAKITDSTRQEIVDRLMTEGAYGFIKEGLDRRNVKGLPATAAAFVGEILTDPTTLLGGGLIKTAKIIGQTANAVSKGKFVIGSAKSGVRFLDETLLTSDMLKKLQAGTLSASELSNFAVRASDRSVQFGYKIAPIVQKVTSGFSSKLAQDIGKGEVVAEILGDARMARPEAKVFYDQLRNQIYRQAMELGEGVVRTGSDGKVLVSPNPDIVKAIAFDVLEDAKNLSPAEFWARHSHYVNIQSKLERLSPSYTLKSIETIEKIKAANPEFVDDIFPADLPPRLQELANQAKAHGYVIVRRPPKPISLASESREIRSGFTRVSDTLTPELERRIFGGGEAMDIAKGTKRAKGTMDMYRIHVTRTPEISVSDANNVVKVVSGPRMRFSESNAIGPTLRITPPDVPLEKIYDFVTQKYNDVIDQTLDYYQYQAKVQAQLARQTFEEQAASLRQWFKYVNKTGKMKGEITNIGGKRWEDVLDVHASELGYADGEALKEAIEAAYQTARDKPWKNILAPTREQIIEHLSYYKPDEVADIMKMVGQAERLEPGTSAYNELVSRMVKEGVIAPKVEIPTPEVKLLEAPASFIMQDARPKPGLIRKLSNIVKDRSIKSAQLKKFLQNNFGVSNTKDLTGEQLEKTIRLISGNKVTVKDIETVKLEKPGRLADLIGVPRNSFVDNPAYFDLEPIEVLSPKTQLGKTLSFFMPVGVSNSDRLQYFRQIDQVNERLLNMRDKEGNFVTQDKVKQAMGLIDEVFRNSRNEIEAAKMSKDLLTRAFGNMRSPIGRILDIPPSSLYHIADQLGIPAKEFYYTVKNSMALPFYQQGLNQIGITARARSPFVDQIARARLFFKYEMNPIFHAQNMAENRFFEWFRGGAKAEDFPSSVRAIFATPSISRPDEVAAALQRGGGIEPVFISQKYNAQTVERVGYKAFRENMDTLLQGTKFKSFDDLTKEMAKVDPKQIASRIDEAAQRGVILGVDDAIIDLKPELQPFVRMMQRARDNAIESVERVILFSGFRTGLEKSVNYVLFPTSYVLRMMRFMASQTYAPLPSLGGKILPNASKMFLTARTIKGIQKVATDYMEEKFGIPADRLRELAPDTAWFIQQFLPLGFADLGANLDPTIRLLLANVGVPNIRKPRNVAKTYIPALRQIEDMEQMYGEWRKAITTGELSAKAMKVSVPLSFVAEANAMLMMNPNVKKAPLKTAEEIANEQTSEAKLIANVKAAKEADEEARQAERGAISAARASLKEQRKALTEEKKALRKEAKEALDALRQQRKNKKGVAPELELQPVDQRQPEIQPVTPRIEPTAQERVARIRR